MPLLTCPACSQDSSTPITGICTACANRMATRLAEIVTYASACAERVEPERTGETGGARAFGSKSPANDARVDYAHHLGWIDHHQDEGTDPDPRWDATRRRAWQSLQDARRLTWDRDGLAMLYSWERTVRDERHLTAPALLDYAGSQLGEIRTVCTFLITHLPWIAEQPWADEMVREVIEIHRAGAIALRALPPRRGRITCPGDDPETGDICNETIWLPDDLADYVRQPGEHAPKRTLYCHNCTSTWSFDRLLRVAIAVDPRAVVRGFGKEFIERHLGISRRHVNRLLAGREAG